MSKPVKVKDSEGNEFYAAPSQDEFGNRTWVKVEYTDPGASAKANPAPPPRSGGRPRTPQTTVENDLAEQSIEMERLNADPAAKRRALEATNMGFWEKFGHNAIRETDKLIAGIGDLIDSGAVNGGLMPGNPYAALIDKDIHKNRMEERAVTQNRRRTEFKEIADRSGAALLGAAAPYLLTGRYMDAPVRGVVEGIGTGLKTAGRGVVNRGLAPLANRIQGRARTDGVDSITQLAKDVDTNISQPIQRLATSISNRPRLSFTYRDKPVKDLAVSAGVGGIEGGLNYDESIAEGVTSSILGSGAGMLKEPLLSKARNINDRTSASINPTLDWATQEGYRVLPGMRTGQPKYQQFENDLRGSDEYSGIMKQVDDANQEVIKKVAGRAMGMKEGEFTNLTAESLRGHRDALKARYQALEENSVGKIDKEQVGLLVKNIEALPKAQRKAATEQLNRLVNIKQLTGRNERGQFTPATFNGTDYQDLRRRYKQAADGAYGKSDFESYNFYRDLMKSLDDGMQRGVREFKGEASANDWKRLNEEFAMTKLVMNNGMDELNRLDLNRLQSNMKGDIERTLMEEGGNIQDLQKLIKLNEIDRNQQGGGLARRSSEEETTAERDRIKFLSTPNSLTLSPLNRTRAQMYISGYPATTGLLGMSPDSAFWNTAQLARAGQQGTDMYGKLIEGTANAGQSGYDYIQEMFNLKDEEEKQKGLLE